MQDAGGSVLGLDVGWSAKRASTGICGLTWSATHVRWDLRNVGTSRGDRESAIRQVLAGHDDVHAVAVDGPLRPDLGLVVAYRSCEAILSRGNLQRRGKPGPTNGGSGPELHRQATALALLARDTVNVATWPSPRQLDEPAIVEAFPNMFLGALLATAGYPARPLRKRKWTDTLYPLVRERLLSLIESTLPGRTIFGKTDLKDHEEIAALTCAVTALCAAAGAFTAVGSYDDGFILLPPREFLGDGWFDDLRANASAARRAFAGALLYEGGSLIS